jgi:MFS family permease
MSVYYFSQIIGGVVMGSLSDVISRRDILIISFLGSAVSYAAVGLSSDLYVLFGSRIVVGLVKQTMSISTAIMSSLCADPLVRAKQIGHISATVTLVSTLLLPFYIQYG